MPVMTPSVNRNPAAMSVVHVAKGIFYSRPSAKGEDNRMIGIRKEYEASGGKFIEYSDGTNIFPGAWLTGPVPRKYPERNWSDVGKMQTPTGLVEDNLPEDQSVVINTNRGLVVITGCGHAGIVNMVSYARVLTGVDRVMAVMGGFHLGPANSFRNRLGASVLTRILVSKSSPEENPRYSWVGRA